MEQKQPVVVMLAHLCWYVYYKTVFDNVVMEISAEFGPMNIWLRKLICCHGNCHGSRVEYFLTSWPHMKRGVFPSCYYLPFRLGFRDGGVAQIWLLVQRLLTQLLLPNLTFPFSLFLLTSLTLNLHKLLCCLSPSAHCPCTTRASSRPFAPQRCFIYFNLIWCYLI